MTGFVIPAKPVLSEAEGGCGNLKTNIEFLLYFMAVIDNNKRCFCRNEKNDKE